MLIRSLTLLVAVGALVGLPSASAQTTTTTTTTRTTTTRTTTRAASSTSTASSNGTATFTKFCTSDKNFCIAAIPDSATNPTSVQFTMWSLEGAWVGFGIGSGMADADIYVGWKSSSGAMIVSDRSSSGQVIPSVDSSQQITVGSTVPSVLGISSSAKTVVTFTRKTSAVSAPNKAISSGTNSYIYAYSKTAPVGDTASSSFGYHDGRGSFSFDFLSLSSSSSSSAATVSSSSAILVMDRTMVIYIHGSLMVVAWAVCPLIGIFIARYMKDVLGKWWYYTHLGVMLGGTAIVGTFGIVFIVLTTAGPHFSYTVLHKLAGLIVGVLALLQVALGFVCNSLWSPDRPAVPWWDKAHWWVGRILFLLGLVNIYFGLRLADSSLAIIISFFVFVGVALAVLVAGQFYFGGAIHHVKKDDGSYDSGKGMEIGRPYVNNNDGPSYSNGGQYNNNYNSGTYSNQPNPNGTYNNNASYRY